MTKRGRGQPRKITEHIARKIFLLAGYGLTDKQLADVFDISEDTLNEFKKRVEYSESLKRIKATSDLAVVNALYNRAIGYRYKEQAIAKSGFEYDIVELEKQSLPDVTACIFWLKNRQRTLWRDKIEDKELIAQEAKTSITQIFANITIKQHAEIVAGADPMKTLFGDDRKNEWDPNGSAKPSDGAPSSDH